MVEATDTDGTAVMEFELRNADGTFEVNPTTGAIKLLTQLNGAVKTTYLLQTCVKSSGVQTCRNITAIVINTNSNAPDFGVSKMEISVSSTAVNGTLVSNTSATDADGDTITYSMNALDDATVATVFALNPSNGHITVQAPTVPGQYHLFLIATDGTLTTAIPVTITVPLNNAGQTTPPKFKQTSYSVTIYSDSTTFLQVQALDAPDTASLRYSFQSDDSGGLFTIDEMTGDISRKTGSTVTIGDMYKLTVAAVNQRSGLNGTALVRIAVSSKLGGGLTKRRRRSTTQDANHIVLVTATHALLNLTLTGFNEQHVVSYMIYGQEYASSMDMTTKTGQEPVTYHQAFNSTNKELYRYRVYKVASISLDSVKAKRTKRFVCDF